jgi:hypothetical protein
MLVQKEEFQIILGHYCPSGVRRESIKVLRHRNVFVQHMVELRETLEMDLAFAEAVHRVEYVLHLFCSHLQVESLQHDFELLDGDVTGHPTSSHLSPRLEQPSRLYFLGRVQFGSQALGVLLQPLGKRLVDSGVLAGDQTELFQLELVAVPESNNIYVSDWILNLCIIDVAKEKRRTGL